MEKKLNKILIFIITYKASYRVKKVFKEIPFKKLNKYKIYTLISDDASDDETIKYIKEIYKKNKNVFYNINNKNLGYGRHIKNCLNFAIRKKFDYAIMIHGDGQYSPMYIPKILEKFKKKPNIGAVVGSRILRGLSKVRSGGMPLYKMFGNIFLTKFYNYLLDTNFTDAHSGLWGYNLKYLKKKEFNNLADTFNFDQDIRFFYVLNKKEIAEVPINTYYGDERSQLHIVYAVKFFFFTIKYLLIKLKFFKNTLHLKKRKKF